MKIERLPAGVFFFLVTEKKERREETEVLASFPLPFVFYLFKMLLYKSNNLADSPVSERTCLILKVSLNQVFGSIQSF